MRTLTWWLHLFLCAWHRTFGGTAESARSEANLARYLVRDADTRMRQRTLNEIETRAGHGGPAQ